MKRKGKKNTPKKKSVTRTRNVSDVLEVNVNLLSSSTLNDSCIVISDGSSDVDIVNHNSPSTSDIMVLEADEVSSCANNSKNNKRTEGDKAKPRCFPGLTDFRRSDSKENTFHKNISSVQRLGGGNGDEVEVTSIVINDDNKKNNKTSENTGSGKVKRSRRCFPTLSDETKEGDSTDKECKIYTSQIQLLRKKKDKVEDG